MQNRHTMLHRRTPTTGNDEANAAIESYRRFYFTFYNAPGNKANVSVNHGTSIFGI